MELFSWSHNICCSFSFGQKTVYLETQNGLTFPMNGILLETIIFLFYKSLFIFDDGSTICLLNFLFQRTLICIELLIGIKDCQFHLLILLTVPKVLSEILTGSKINVCFLLIPLSSSYKCNLKGLFEGELNRETTHKKLFLSFTCYIIFNISVSMTKDHLDNVHIYQGRNILFFNQFITLNGSKVIKEGQRTWTASRQSRSQLLGLQNITGEKNNERNGMKDHLRATTYGKKAARLPVCYPQILPLKV